GPAVLRGELEAGGDSANVQIVRDTSRREEAVPQTPWCRSLYQLSVFDDRCHEWSLPSVSGERGRSRDDTTAPVQSGGSGLDRASGVDLSGRRTGGAQAGGVLAQRSARVHHVEALFGEETRVQVLRDVRRVVDVGQGHNILAGED